MTEWYPPSTLPVRDGLYVIRYIYTPGCVSDCWSMARWDCSTKQWYTAGSKGTGKGERIGIIGKPLRYQWRGLKEPTK